MNAVHFGAGNIGRGFIGLLLSQSGYDVFFVTRNPHKIAQLRHHRHYRVNLAKEGAQPITVRNVNAASIEDFDEVARVLTMADLVTTAVGVPALKSIAKSIARGIIRRLRLNPQPLNIIACENAIGASSQLKKWVYSHLPEETQALADRYIAFPNTVVDRIVPLQTHQDILAVTVEPFAEWIIDGSAVIGDKPKIQGVTYVDRLTPYVERKLYTLNTGHCAAAYYGYLEGYQTIHEVLQDASLRNQIEAVLTETGDLLIQKHHLDKELHRIYIQKTLDRFANVRLNDAVVRVGRSPLRKLSPKDRLVNPTLQAYAMGLEVSHLVSVIAAALMFDVSTDKEAVRLQSRIRDQGLEQVVVEVTGIDASHPLYAKVVEAYQQLDSKYHDRPIGAEL